MSNLKMKDFDGTAAYLKMGGAGTDIDPHIPVQDVRIQDQTTPQFSLYLGEMRNTSLTLTGAVSENDETAAITSTTLPIVGNFLCLKENAFFTQMEITGVTGGGPAYTLDLGIPMVHDYTTGEIGRASCRERV